MWNKLKEQFNLLKLEKKKLYLVTNSNKFESKEIFLDAIASALQGGVDMVELCEPKILDNVLVEMGRKIRALCDEFGATFVVNGRCDIAKIVEADGVILDDACVSVSDAREVLGENAIIGIDINSANDAVEAFNNGADYIKYNYVHINRDKTISQNIIEDLDWIKENIELPFFVAGDVNSDNISTFVQYGIDKIVVSDSVMYAQVPEKTARNMLKFLP